jgi:hypothetical protein
MTVGSESRYFVQLRFPGAEGWVTVAAAPTRQSAAAYAGAAFLNARDESLHQAVEVRIVSEEQLRGAHGADAVDAALESLDHHHVSGA